MRIKTFEELLKFNYTPNKLMKQRHPKAAKKRRVRTKWKNRFGADVDFEKIMNGPSIFDGIVLKESSWSGGTITIPTFKEIK